MAWKIFLWLLQSFVRKVARFRSHHHCRMGVIKKKKKNLSIWFYPIFMYFFYLSYLLRLACISVVQTSMHDTLRCIHFYFTSNILTPRTPGALLHYACTVCFESLALKAKKLKVCTRIVCTNVPSINRHTWNKKKLTLYIQVDFLFSCGENCISWRYYLKEFLSCKWYSTKFMRSTLPDLTLSHHPFPYLTLPSLPLSHHNLPYPTPKAAL